MNFTNPSSTSQVLDATRTMYPSRSKIVQVSKNQRVWDTNLTSTFYGYVASGNIKVQIGQSRNFATIAEGNAFSIPGEYQVTSPKATVWFVERFGFIGQLSSTRVEQTGRLSYIDGCSDTMLVYPPRKGDPSVSSLHFPPRVTQTVHTHPSIRMGYVVSGHGIACLGGGSEEHYCQVPLKPGVSFLLNSHELHRFVTDEDERGLTLVAFHPDGDWGPEDRNHTMLNRTYLK